MESDDSDDLLRLLLSYDCPFTGRKRMAGAKDKVNGRSAKTLADVGEQFQSESAACSHVVELAQAQAAEHPAPCRALRDFAGISLAHAERGCHRVFKRYGFSANVYVEKINLGSNKLKEFPYIKMSSWVRLLLDSKRVQRQLCGVATWEQMNETLKEFWSRYRELHPTHEIFTRDHVDLACAIPVFSHTDEGRSYKHQPLWVLSTHGCLGRGTKEYVDKGKHLVPIKRRGMGLNFLGNTWSNQFIFCTMLRAVTVEFPESMTKLVELYAEDMAMLADQGVANRRGDRRVWVVHLATKGDLPALSKLGGFKRNHSHVPKAGSSKKACQGICHMCLGGKESSGPGDTAFPYEDTSVEPKWEETVEVEDPWDNVPAILRGLPMCPEKKASFFVTDVWHNLHLGLSKHFFASSIISAVERLDTWSMDSVESRLEWFTNDFKRYCREKGAKSVYAINTAVSFMYANGYWIKSDEARKLSMWIMVFLQGFTTCAEITLREGCQRYALMPKLHFLHHSAWRLLQEARRGRYAVNPLSESVQCQEDYIGRPCRLSRRVDVRLIHSRVMERALICSQEALEASDRDQRGLVIPS
eukprot:s185_g21.t2